MLGYYKMSMIGTAHQAKEGGVCQDASDVIVLKNGWIAAAIADGLGSAKQSEKGAAAAVKAVLSFVDGNYPKLWHEESLISLLRIAFHKAWNTIQALSEENGDEICDYDTTLTAVLYNGTNAVYGHVGDGGIIALSSYGKYSVLTKAQKGEAFNETSPLRAGPDSWTFGAANEDVCALVMMTDGIFDIACPWLLSKSAQPVYVNYIRPFMDINILKVSSPEDFEHAQAEITEFFGSPDSRQITDDKTIVGIINTEIMPEVRPESYYEEPDWEALAREHRERLYDRGETMQESSGLSGSSPQQTDAVAECGKKAPEPWNDSGQSNESEKPKTSGAREPLETGKRLLKKLLHKSRKEAEESDRM